MGYSLEDSKNYALHPESFKLGSELLDRERSFAFNILTDGAGLSDNENGDVGNLELKIRNMAANISRENQSLIKDALARVGISLEEGDFEISVADDGSLVVTSLDDTPQGKAVAQKAQDALNADSDTAKKISRNIAKGNLLSHLMESTTISGSGTPSNGLNHDNETLSILAALQNDSALDAFLSSDEGAISAALSGFNDKYNAKLESTFLGETEGSAVKQFQGRIGSVFDAGAVQEAAKGGRLQISNGKITDSNFSNIVTDAQKDVEASLTSTVEYLNTEKSADIETFEAVFSLDSGRMEEFSANGGEKENWPSLKPNIMDILDYTGILDFMKEELGDDAEGKKVKISYADGKISFKVIGEIDAGKTNSLSELFNR